MTSESPITCGACGASNGADARFCAQCGKPVATAPADSGDAAERKQVTVLFSDLTGFTALTEKLDPEEARQIVASIFERAAEIVGRYEGRIEKFVGDAVMAIFGVPLAHEDDPQRAVRAALELHQAVAGMSPGIEDRTGVAIALHSGINTGVVVTGELQFDHGTAGPLGDTINTAARLMNGAASGQIWIGPETRRLVAGSFDLENLGEQTFKGKAQPLAVSRVIGISSQADASANADGRGAFVGRQAELGALLGAAEKIRDGQPQVIGIAGDAGTGKTRLVSEFRNRLGEDVHWLEGRTYPYEQDTPYSVFIDLLNRAWQIEESDTPAQVREKIQAGVENALGSNDNALALYLHLYNLAPDDGGVEREAFRERLLDATHRVLDTLGARAPTVVCLQDLHWADPSSVDLLADLAASLQAPVMLLGNYRPGYVAPAGMTELPLGELSARQTGALLKSLLSDDPPEALTRFVTERSDGNPFFIEEVVNSLLETGVLARADNQWALLKPLDQAAVPPTIRGIIAARIDRLEESRRMLLRHAAVVGRAFMVRIITLIRDDTSDLAPALGQLEAADLIRQRQQDPDVEYMFKHALTHDVAYEGLLKSDRERLHARVAHAMEDVYATRLPEFVEMLAYHYQRGGEPEKAVHYLVESGKKCVERYALPEADRHYRQAYELAAQIGQPATRNRALAELLIAWSQVHYYDGTISEWHPLLEKHLPDAQACNDPALLVIYLGWLGNARCFHGDFVGGNEALERATAIGREQNIPETLAIVVGWHAFALAERARVDEAIRVTTETRYSPDEKNRARYSYVKAQAGLAHALLFRGEFAACRQVANDLIELGRATGNSRAETMGHEFVALAAALALDFDESIRAGDAGIKCARDKNFQGMIHVCAAIAHVLSLDFDTARKISDQWLEYFDRNENNWFGLQMKMVGASVDLAHGELSDGLRRFLALVRQAQNQGMIATTALSETFLLFTYVSIARLDVKPSVGALFRNPWFVFTQAPFAARKARRLAARLRETCPSSGFDGLLNMVDYCEGRLLAHQRRQADADACLQRIRERLRQAGVETDTSAVTALAGEIRGAAR